MFSRLGPAAGPAPSHALGGRWVGAADAALHAPLLAPAGAWLDAWSGSPAVQTHQHGCVRYATDGHWLYGCATVDEHALGMQAATQQAYADLFAVLAASPCHHLLRLWNYFAGINIESGGSERYRQFNAGRQQAFIEAQRSAFDGSPAACALGMQGGTLQVSFLAGTRPPLAIENPRQVSAYRYPDTYGPRAPTFSRAAVADAGDGRGLLFISGTASIVGHVSMHVGDVRRQTEESLANIAAVRGAAEARSGHTFPPSQMHYTLYLRQPADMAVVREVFERAVGPDSPAARGALYLHADVCRADLLVEIEAHGYSAARSLG
ncbi:MAG TPA: hypothetical protein VFL64_16315 [Rhizobacter sp.]|nr:hypothetical protein [Rhizobacter sp.]